MQRREPWSEMSDAQLVAACRDGSEEAWNEIVTRYEALVYTIPRRYGLTAPEVEDVFQSVWLALVTHLSTLTQPHRLSAWLVTTARRACWDRRRGAAYERTDFVGTDILQEKKWGDQLTPEQLVIQYEQQQQVRHALSQLDARCQRLLTFLYYDPAQPSYDEIATALGLSIGSIGPIRGRCLDRLRKLLNEES